MHFSSSFFSMCVSNGYRKSYRIFHSSDSGTLSASCMVHFSVFWNLHFSVSNWSSYLYYALPVCSPFVLFWNIVQPCVLLFNLLHHTIDLMEIHLLQIYFLMLFVENAWSNIAKISLSTFFKYPFFTSIPWFTAHYFTYCFFSLSA